MTDDEALLRRRRRPMRAGPLWWGLSAAVCCAMTAIVALLLTAPQGNVILDDSLKPPYSTSTAELVPGVAITVDHDGFVQVDSRKVGVLGEPGFEAALHAALTTRRHGPTHRDGRFDGNLMLIADRDTPFGDISTIVTTAYSSGFPNVRFVTLAM